MVQAEFIKLRYAPLLWLSGLIVVVVLGVITIAHYLDVNSVAVFDVNPWGRISTAAYGIFSVFLGIPFVTLFISAAMYVEHTSRSWKTQYAIPVPRYQIILSKMLSYIVWFAVILAVLLFGMAGCGLFLSALFPEMEFAYYAFPITSFLGTFVRTLIALLGVIGIQYFLGFRFKGFLVPASIGIVAFIIGLILTTTNNPMALYFPYSYPMISQDMEMFKLDKINIVDLGWLSNVEFISIGVFVFFVTATIFLETRKNVTG